MKRFLGAFALFLLLPSAAAAADGVLIRNATVYDGSDQPPRRADVRVQDGKIEAVERNLHPQKGDQVRDANGLALAPGFVDMHSHADDKLLQIPTADTIVLQGVTTVLVGQDGGSEFPLTEFFSKVEKQGTAVNVASMVGHGTIRRQVMGADFLRASTPAELEKMKALLKRELAAGAFGLSSGLEYDAGQFATTDELVELARVAAGFGGFYISHVRDEGNGVFESFREVIEIGRRGGLPVQITHIKLATTPVWKQAPTRVPQLFADAARQGVDLKADVYPYTYWQSTLRVIVLDRDYFNQQKVARALEENGGPARLRITRYQPDQSIEGLTLNQVASKWKVSAVEAFMRIVRETLPGEDGEGAEQGVIGESMLEEDVRWFIAHPRIMYSSDGELRGPHPRGAGAFPRILGRYVREQRSLPLHTAIHKMTSLPAQQLGLSDRGRIAPGYAADLVLFDPERVKDRSTVENPHAPPDGIEAVMVNGVWVSEMQRVTGARPGKILRKAPPKSGPAAARPSGK